MMSFKTPLGLLLVAMLAMVAESSSDKENGPYKYNLSNKSDLDKLYNSKVYMTELYKSTRLLTILSPMKLSGVRVTLKDGSKWMIYKWITSKIVVEDGRQMANYWELKEQKDFRGSKTVYDFVKAAEAGTF